MEIAYVITELSKKYPNDMELGKRVRSLVHVGLNKYLPNDSDLGIFLRKNYTI